MSVPFYFFLIRYMDGLLDGKVLALDSKGTWALVGAIRTEHDKAMQKTKAATISCDFRMPFFTE